MFKLLINQQTRRSVLLLLMLMLLAAPTTPFVSSAQQNAVTQQPRTPTEAVREFYRALREKRFREAFAMSIYKPAVEGLSAEEFEELRPDFERMGAAVPVNLEISGEQISGDTATVFVKIAASSDSGAQSEPVTLMRKGNEWIVGDKDSEKVVIASGKEFFIKARIDTHHGEVQAMLQRISLAEIAYSAQHGGVFADLPTLIAAGLVPKDIESTDSTGYSFHITLASDKKSYTAGAEPARYGRTGRLSFYLDNKIGIKSGDVKGKRLNP